jgi:hypothetical protein
LIFVWSPINLKVQNSDNKKLDFLLFSFSLNYIYRQQQWILSHYNSSRPNIILSDLIFSVLH